VFEEGSPIFTPGGSRQNQFDPRRLLHASTAIAAK